jgi:hypothetical protein
MCFLGLFTAKTPKNALVPSCIILNGFEKKIVKTQ